MSVTGAGVYGVDLFFALSAYLITSLLLRERTALGDVNLRSFYVRRILRIWPLYLGFIGFAVLSSPLIASHRLPFHYTVGYCLLAGNWICVVCGPPNSFVSPLWTVSIEEQFYLVWPVVLRRASLRRMTGIAIGVLAVASSSRVLLAASGVSLTAFKYNTFTRLDPIAMGVLLAIFGNRMPILLRWQRVAFLLTSFGSFIVVYTLCFSSTWRLTLGYPVTALASSAVLVSVLGAQHPFLRNRAILYLGKISYGLYVFHAFGISCASHLFPTLRPVGILVQSGLGLALTILFATVSYRYLEVPFLKFKERFAYVPSRPV